MIAGQNPFPCYCCTFSSVYVGGERTMYVCPVLTVFLNAPTKVEAWGGGG